MPGGRPSTYDPALCEQAAALCAGGATDEEIAEAFGVTVRTIYRWQAQYPQFCQALKAGKEPADERVVRSLYHRATGFSWVEQQAIKVKDISYDDNGRRNESERVEIVEVERVLPPDTTAGIFWLKNRRASDWRDKQDHEHTGKDGGPIIPVLNVYTNSDDRPSPAPKAINGTRLNGH